MDNITFEKKTLSKAVRLIVFNLFSIITIFLVFAGIFIFDYRTSERVFKVKSLIQIESQDGSLFAFDQTFLPRMSAINLEEESQIYKSRGSLIELIKEVKLDLRVYDGFGNPVDQINNNYFDEIIYERLNTDNQIVLSIDLNDDYYLISFSNGEKHENLKYGTLYTFEGLNININRGEKRYLNDDLTISMPTYEYLLKWIKGSVILNSFASTRSYIPSTLIEVFTLSSNLSESKRIIDAMNDIYINGSLKKKAEQARISGTFIQDRISDVLFGLDESEKQLNEFQSKNLLFEVGQKGKAYVEQLNEIETQLNTLSLERVQNESIYSKESLIIKNLDAQQDLLKSRKSEIEKEIASLPEKEQLYINLLKNVEVQQSLLDLLRNKQLEFSIVEASTISDIRIVDKAYTSDLVSPKLLYSAFFYFCLALLTTAFFLAIKVMFFTRISSPSEIIELDRDHEFLGIMPVLGENITSGETEVPANLLDQIRTVTNNFRTQLSKEQKIILTTGPISGVGKTFSSLALAYGLSYSGNKVAVIDCDWRRGDVHKFFKLNRPKSFENFLNLIDTKHNACFFGSNFDVFLSPKKSSHLSLSYFSSQQFKNFIERIKDEYDFIILDTAPILSVTDTLTLSQSADAVLIINRHRVNSEKQYLQCFDTVSAVNNKIFTVYNAFERPPFHYEAYYNYYSYYNYNYYYKDEYNYESDD